MNLYDFNVTNYLGQRYRSINIKEKLSLLSIRPSIVALHRNMRI